MPKLFSVPLLFNKFFLPALLRIWTGPHTAVELKGQPGPKVGPEGKVARPVA